MGKKGGWFSAIKRVFLPHSKEKLITDTDKRSTKEKKKKGLAKLRRGETNSFLPLFREPSSIEKILDEAEREHNLIFRPPTPPEQPRTPSVVHPLVSSPRVPSQRITSPKAASPRITSPRAASPRVASPRAATPRVASPRAAPPSVTSPKAASSRSTLRQKDRYYGPEPTPGTRHASAIKIQAAYRGYMARRSFRALKGLVRIQGVIRGQNVKRQVTTALKYMQLFVRVQTQIQSRRIQMLGNQSQQHIQLRNDKEVESTLSKWSQMSEAGHQEDWDDSLLTKEEVDARLQRKVEAIVNRERAKAYVNTYQSWRSAPKSGQSAVTNIQSTGFPWWCNWLERQLPLANSSESQTMRNLQLTPPRLNSVLKPSPRPSSSNQNTGFDNIDTPTPRSSKSTAFIPTRKARTPVYSNSPGNNSTMSKYSRARAAGAESPFGLKDDDSLMSCPLFSAPRYMAPTISAQAKARSSSNPKERFPGTPSSEKKRLSFPLTPSIGSFKWNKGSSVTGKDSSSQLDKQSVGNMSVDSTVSMPANVGRKPFNRFV